MKLLYKGSECGVPCTCPAAEEEYVWWDPGVEPLTSTIGSITISTIFPVQVSPMAFRVTFDVLASSVSVALRKTPNTSTNLTTSAFHIGSGGYNIDGSDAVFPIWSTAADMFVSSISFKSGETMNLSNLKILVSKSDYAKLMEASGS